MYRQKYKRQGEVVLVVKREILIPELIIAKAIKLNENIGQYGEVKHTW